MDTTTITLDRALKRRLDALKRTSRESYSEVLKRILESMQRKGVVDEESLRETVEILSDPEAMRDLAQSLDDIKAGRLYSIDEV